MMENILKILTTATIDGDDKLLTALFLNFIFSVIIFVVSKLIYSLRNEKNVLELDNYDIIDDIDDEESEQRNELMTFENFISK